MKRMRAVTALWASIPLMISGCQKQPKQTFSPPATAQKAAAPVLVSSKTVSSPQASAKANENLGNPRDQASRLNLPQSDEHAVVQGAARTALEAAVSGASRSAPLPDSSASTLIDNLPKGFRDSCDQMMAGWGNTLQGTAKWSVRLLFSFPHQSGGTEAVLAFRCASAFRGLEQDYDERPATIVLTPEAATLTLIPIQPECDSGCSHLYHLEFSQAFPAAGAQLVELRVYHTSDNPCCGGADEESGSLIMILDLPRAKQVLVVDERTEHESHDDSDEGDDSQTVCEAKVSYRRDGEGSVESIATERQCTKNKQPLPEVNRQNFQWNAAAHKFEEVK
jgi:hypothetical protein